MSTATIKKRIRKPAKKKAVRKTVPKNFGEWARSVAGMIKDAPADLSTREGFGN